MYSSLERYIKKLKYLSCTYQILIMIINAFDHMEFCLVISLTMVGNWAVIWLAEIATRYVSFVTALNTRQQVLATNKKNNFLH